MGIFVLNLSVEGFVSFLYDMDPTLFSVCSTNIIFIKYSLRKLFLHPIFSYARRFLFRFTFIALNESLTWLQSRLKFLFSLTTSSRCPPPPSYLVLYLAGALFISLFRCILSCVSLSFHWFQSPQIDKTRTKKCRAIDWNVNIILSGLIHSKNWTQKMSDSLSNWNVSIDTCIGDAAYIVHLVSMH